MSLRVAAATELSVWPLRARGVPLAQAVGRGREVGRGLRLIGVRRKLGNSFNPSSAIRAQ